MDACPNSLQVLVFGSWHGNVFETLLFGPASKFRSAVTIDPTDIFGHFGAPAAGLKYFGVDLFVIRFAFFGSGRVNVHFTILLWLL